MLSPRSSVHRWRRVSRLLLALERVIEGTARLDAYTVDRAETRGRPRSIGVEVCAQMDELETRIDREVDRCTAALLKQQLEDKIRRNKRSVAA